MPWRPRSSGQPRGEQEPVGARPLPYDPRSWDGFAARWLRWVASCGWERSPIRDPDGHLAHVNQPDDVWFLAGTFGADVVRRCTIPSGRLVFFPILNVWGPAHFDVRQPGAALAAEVDGVPITPFELSPPEPFDVASDLPNPVTDDAGLRSMRIWGWWGQVAGFAPGPHSVSFRGRIDLVGDPFALDVRYELTVE